MATTRSFRYAVRDAAGRRTTGTLDAGSQEAVVGRLRAQGYVPLSVREARTGLDRELRLPGADRVSAKDLAVMSRQFATMIGAGLPLVRTLAILAEQTGSVGLRRALAQVLADVEAGASLSVTLAAQPRVFPPLLVSMCRAGELGGFLDAALLQTADTLEAEVDLRSKVRSAMTYPTVVLVFAVLATVAVLLFIVPVFAGMYAGFGAQLPLPTRVLLQASAVLRYLGPVLVVLAVAAALVWRRVRWSPRVRHVLDPLALRLPVFGPLVQKVAVSRFSRNLATMLTSGVPILQSLQVVAETSGSTVVESAVEDASASVARGESLSGPLREHHVFPPMLVQMLAVGEESGATDTMLHKLADFYEAEVTATTARLTALVEPLMIVVIGALVGGMVVCLYLPMFGVYDLIG